MGLVIHPTKKVKNEERFFSDSFWEVELSRGLFFSHFFVWDQKYWISSKLCIHNFENMLQNTLFYIRFTEPEKDRCDAWQSFPIKGFVSGINHDFFFFIEIGSEKCRFHYGNPFLLTFYPQEGFMLFWFSNNVTNPSQWNSNKGNVFILPYKLCRLAG